MTALDQLGVLKLVTGRLDGAGIPYMVTGSIAAGHYAQPRMTRDIDLVVDLQPQDADRIATLFSGEFECSLDAIRAAIGRASMFNLIHTEAIVKVDFVVRKNTPYRLEEFGRRRITMIDAHPVQMVSPEDLVLSKLVWAKDTRSELQLRDVRHIISAQPGLDWSYLERWANGLSVIELLREVRP
ncbi:MAG: nucleotidyl transferase AbiEii/AbiGii toxin family protein [Vicinamibacterales bacterium]